MSIEFGDIKISINEISTTVSVRNVECEVGKDIKIKIKYGIESVASQQNISVGTACMTAHEAARTIHNRTQTAVVPQATAVNVDEPLPEIKAVNRIIDVSPFITNLTKFFQIIKNDNIYISGSTVLQSITKEKYNGDLDIYFTKRPNKKYEEKQVKNDKVLFDLLMFLRDEEGYTSEKTQFTGICSINTYFKLTRFNSEGIEQKIDIIIDRECIQSIISKFYATHVMNYYNLDDNKIYSVRPTATAKKISYICDWFLTKYRNDYNDEFVNEFRDNRNHSHNYNTTFKAENFESDNLAAYSEYFKYKKIDSILKYKLRGFTFQSYSKIDSDVGPFEKKIVHVSYIDSYTLVNKFTPVDMAIIAEIKSIEDITKVEDYIKVENITEKNVNMLTELKKEIDRVEKFYNIIKSGENVNRFAELKKEIERVEKICNIIKSDKDAKENVKIDDNQIIKIEESIADDEDEHFEDAENAEENVKPEEVADSSRIIKFEENTSETFSLV